MLFLRALECRGDALDLMVTDAADAQLGDICADERYISRHCPLTSAPSRTSETGNSGYQRPLSDRLLLYHQRQPDEHNLSLRTGPSPPWRNRR